MGRDVPPLGVKWNVRLWTHYTVLDGLMPGDLPDPDTERLAVISKLHSEVNLNHLPLFIKGGMGELDITPYPLFRKGALQTFVSHHSMGGKPYLQPKTSFAIGSGSRPPVHPVVPVAPVAPVAPVVPVAPKRECYPPLLFLADLLQDFTKDLTFSFCHGFLSLSRSRQTGIRKLNN